MLKKLSPLITCLFFCFAACTCAESSSFKGKVIDLITQQPVKLNLTATTETDIVEYKSRAILNTTSSKDGSFQFRNCLPNKSYNIKITDQTYVYDEVETTCPDKNLTKEIPLIKVAKKPFKDGIFIWDGNKAVWKELEINTTFKVERTDIRPALAFDSVLDIYIPLNLGKDPVVLSELKPSGYDYRTDVFNGHFSQPSVLEKSHQLKYPPHTLFAVYGDDFMNYELMGLFYYPRLSIFDKRGSQGYPGTFTIPEGYHLGIKSVRGVGQCCKYLDLKREHHILKITDMANSRIGALRFGYYAPPEGTYNAIVPGGKLILYQSKGLDLLLSNGLPGIIFTTTPIEKIKQTVNTETPKSTNIKKSAAPDNNTTGVRTIKGTWRGEINQVGYGSYPAVITLHNIVKDIKCASITYPTLNCGGSLSCIDIQDEKYTFREQIEYGGANCIDNGIIHLIKLDENTFKYEWVHPTGKKDCEGILYYSP